MRRLLLDSQRVNVNSDTCVVNDEDERVLRGCTSASLSAGVVAQATITSSTYTSTSETTLVYAL